MPGLRGRNRGLRGRVIANLTDHNHIRVLTHRRDQCFGKTRRVLTDLALNDHRFLVAVNHLNWVFNRHDHLGFAAVDVIQYRRHRRRFTATRRARHQDDPAPLRRDELNRVERQFDRLELAGVVADDAQHHADTPALPEHIDPKAADAGDAVREINLVFNVKRHALALVEDRRDETLHYLRGERPNLHHDHLAVDAQVRRHPRVKVNIGCALPDTRAEHLIESHESHAT